MLLVLAIFDLSVILFSMDNSGFAIDRENKG